MLAKLQTITNVPQRPYAIMPKASGPLQIAPHGRKQSKHMRQYVNRNMLGMLRKL